MAVIRPSGIISEIRGSIGDTVFSRGQGGPYARFRGISDKERTGLQDATRDTLIYLAQAWSGTLDEAERQAWIEHAKTWPQANRWGDMTLTSGYTRFIKTNFYRCAETSEIPYLTPPPVGSRPAACISATAYESSQHILLTLPPAGLENPLTPLRVWLYCGLPVSAGVNAFRGPWRAIGKLQYTNHWIPSPANFEASYTIAEGNRLWIKAITQSTASGALSPAWTTRCTVGA